MHQKPLQGNLWCCFTNNPDSQVFESSSFDSTLTILVLQEFWEIKELGDELFDIIWVVHEGLPGGRDGVELAVSTVKPESTQGVKSEKGKSAVCCFAIKIQE